MYKQENIKPYKGDEDKGKQVEQMFDNIAPTYDSLNHSLSLEIDAGLCLASSLIALFLHNLSISNDKLWFRLS